MILSDTAPIETLWYSRCPAPTAASIAIRQGWLDDEFAADGIAVRSLAAAQDRAVHLSHYNHSQPNSFRFGGYVPPLVAASRGADLRILGIAWSDRAAALYALPQSDIRTAADLKGRRFALPLRVNDGVDWWRALVLAGYRHALQIANLTFDDIELVEIAIDRSYVDDASTGQDAGRSLWGARSQFAVQREEAAALLRGEIDVVYSDAAMGALLQAFLGLRTVIDLVAPEDQGDTTHGHPLVLTASSGLIEQRPDLVARWIARLLDADDWAQSHQVETRQIIAQDAGLPVDFVEAAYSPRIYDQLDLSLSSPRRALLAAKRDQLIAAGLISTPLNLDSVIDPVPLAAAQALRAERQARDSTFGHRSAGREAEEKRA